MSVLSALSKDEIQKYISDNLPPIPEQPKPGKVICLAILAHDARMFVRTHMSMMKGVIQAVAQKGWGVTYIDREGDSMVARGRSFIASQFLESPQIQHATDLVMIDTDLSWSGDEFIRLCEHDVDVVGGAYPYKDESGNFPLRWSPDGLIEENGLWSVHAVTPGFFRVTRRALEKIARQSPWLEFKDQGNPDGQRSWMFFDNLHRPTGIYDEGYIFCEHWRRCGGKVWLDPDLNLTHTGLKNYNHGSIRDWLARKGETESRLKAEFPDVPDLILAGKAVGTKNYEEARAAVEKEGLTLAIDNTKDSAA